MPKSRLNKFKKMALFALVAGSMSFSQAQAESVRMYDRAPSAAEMGNILFANDKPATTRSMGRTRSISFSNKKPTAEPQAMTKSIDEPAPTKAVAAAEQSASSGPKTIGLPIKFAVNSSNLLDESLPFIEEVGKLLTMAEYSDKRLLIEGHTDSSGNEEYNLLLSYRRANSVKKYLMDNYGIEPQRLRVNGKGESEPLPDMPSTAAKNRRVQFYSVQ